MNAPVEGWIPVNVVMPVYIPGPDGQEIVDTMQVEVSAWKDPHTGEIFLDDTAEKKLDDVKARHMGIILPEQLKALRVSLGKTQKEISQLLQIGEKTWSRWETGRERPSRSMNLFLYALYEGELGIDFLIKMAPPIHRHNRVNGRASGKSGYSNPQKISDQVVREEE
ncbi:MAG: helix-turn-helix domain-containing protein [Opitutales bacterium]|nr:helix-turn-helix domain-containing protein [Opitutales bacterium]